MEEKISLRLDKNVARYLKAIAQEEDTKMSSLLRKALVSFVNAYREESGYLLDDDVFQ